jgi:preprotein translocase subunit YajC
LITHSTLAQTFPATTTSTTTATTAAPGSTAPAPGTQDPPFYASPWFPAVLGLLVFYFILIRPQKNKDKARNNMLANLKRGDRVQTIGGILGTVVEARPDEVVLKVDEGNNTKLKFARSAIHRVLEEEKAGTQ